MSGPEPAAGAEPDVAPWRGRFLLYAVGAGLVAYGLRGIALDAHGWTHPRYWAPALVVAAVAHDLVLVPLVFLLAAPLTRLLPARGRGHLATGLGLSGVLLAVAWAGLHGYGRLPDNPSVLPQDYGHGLLVSLVVVWLAVLAVALGQALRAELRLQRAARAPVSGD